MFDKLTTETTNQLGKLRKRSKKSTGRKKLQNFLIQKGQDKLTTDEMTKDNTNDLEAS